MENGFHKFSKTDYTYTVMKSLLLFTLLLTAFGGQVKADALDTDCDNTAMTEARSLAELPEPINDLLHHENGKAEAIADAVEDYNWTDVSTGDGLARQRFTLAGLNAACAYVAIEKGGRTHHFELLIYKNDSVGWMLIRKRRIEAAPDTVMDLYRYAHITTFWTFTYPRQ